MTKFQKRQLRIMLLSVAASWVLPASSVFAQESLVLEEVIVTARKRAESLQDAPLSISALSGDDLLDSGITNLADVTEHIPNLQITRPSRDSNVYIRGVGPTRGATNVTELSVGVYVDDVFLLKPQGQMVDLAEIESVQVLRGPQGTLFGKNTTGGALVVSTVKPAEVFGGFGQVTAGNDGVFNAQLSADLPISENLLSKLTVTSVKADGFFEDPINGDELSDENRQGALLQLRWLASDNVTADFSIFHSRIRENALAYGDCVVTNREAQIPGNALITPKSGTRLISDFCEETSTLNEGRAGYDVPPAFDLDASQVSMNVSWDLNDNHALKSVTAWRTQETPNLTFTNTYAGYPNGQRSLKDGESTQISQEFQLTGNLLEGSVRYSSGLFYMQDDTDSGRWETFLGEDGIWGSIADSVPAGLVAALTNYNVREQDNNNTTFAAYTQLSWDVTDNFELTAGVRYGLEQRKIDTELTEAQLPWDAFADVPGAIIIPGSAALMTFDTFFNDARSALPLALGETEQLQADEDFESLTPMVSAAYSFPDSMLGDSIDGLLLYASYTEGFKAGGFSNFLLGELVPFEEEEIASVELGMKLDAWDNRLRVNASVFSMDYQEMQLFVARPDPDPNVVGSNQGVTNAGASTINGAELEMTLLPAEGWLVNFSASFADGEFDEFDDFVTDPDTQLPIPLDRSDEDLPSLPESSFSLGVQYEWNSGFGNWLARVDAYYRDELYWGFDALTWQLPLARENSTTDSFTVFNARLQWQINDSLSIAAWGKNLADKTYYDTGVGEAANVGHTIKGFAPPRRFGLDLRYDF